LSYPAPVDSPTLRRCWSTPTRPSATSPTIPWYIHSPHQHILPRERVS
jgi:hypothetical protein